jgi:predicted deacetylase
MIRAFSHTELDDLHPLIQCDSNLIEKRDVLWIIPIFKNYSISNNSEWCKEILNSGKTLGLHGVYHTYNELLTERDSDYIDKGINEFEKCFGFKPKIFKAPQLSFNESNRKLIEEKGMRINGKINQLFHKVYHCSDTGMFPNWIIGLF